MQFRFNIGTGTPLGDMKRCDISCSLDPAMSGAPSSASAQTSDNRGISATLLVVSPTAGAIVCEICQRNFSTQFTLNRHMTTVHGDSAQLLQCQRCDKTFRRRDSLQRHISTHNKSGYHKCRGCKRKFRPDFLQSHLRATTHADCLQAYNDSLSTAAPKLEEFNLHDLVSGRNSISSTSEAGSEPSGTLSHGNTPNKVRSYSLGALQYDERTERYNNIDLEPDVINASEYCGMQQPNSSSDVLEPDNDSPPVQYYMPHALKEPLYPSLDDLEWTWFDLNNFF